MLDDPIPALKQQLAKSIIEEIGVRNMYQAGRMLGLDQPRTWRLEHGRLEQFSVQKLIRLLARLNRRVELKIVVVGPLPTYGDQRIWNAARRISQALPDSVKS